jgi:hypothetical protein
MGIDVLGQCPVFFIFIPGTDDQNLMIGQRVLLRKLRSPSPPRRMPSLTVVE